MCKKWRAEPEGTYYYITELLEVKETIDLRLNDDNSRYILGNYFKCECIAKGYRNEIKMTFRGGYA